jgi:hypothetical protein
VRSALAGEGIEARGPMLEFRDRPWSTIWRIGTSAGDVYFKALIPALTHEVPLTRRLFELFPDVIVPVLAADERRAWMLMYDAGVQLREVITVQDARQVWTKLLDDAALVHSRTLDLVPEFLALGVPDRRLARLGEQLDAFMAVAERAERLPGGGLTAGDHTRLKALGPWLLSRAERLAAYGLPESLQHDDLHDYNVLVKDGKAVIFDWGDASISHPFFTLRVSLISIERTLGLHLDDELPRALRDHYLSHWLAFGPLQRLRQAYELSRPLAIIPRVLCWDLAMTNATDEEWVKTSEIPLIKELLDTHWPE